ncbi:hypothetical protein QBC33DRAFT_571933 [Phialemonium atrogriseum]|uniref:Uncharacterized protein n=1 Tax=Phialemonium atrogriseum TaxID=1093897 RepID=A0AAJ0BXL4_9PEZI|nr:uncharacterized protein QBC33DRAFT_571933 [Phialemonium atrogriseum]KAK1764947.1 hypothetical protein QBC33DRAFT_571933 [Phialemonium atrogriseum]
MTLSGAITDFFNGLYELFASMASVAYRTVHSVFAAVWGLFSGIVNLITDVVGGSVEVVGGVGRFLISNIVVLAIIGAGGFAYVRYRDQQGRPVRVGNKKAN